mgnify:CR=1 FL=1
MHIFEDVLSHENHCQMYPLPRWSDPAAVCWSVLQGVSEKFRLCYSPNADRRSGQSSECHVRCSFWQRRYSRLLCRVFWHEKIHKNWKKRIRTPVKKAGGCKHQFGMKPGSIGKRRKIEQDADEICNADTDQGIEKCAQPQIAWCVLKSDAVHPAFWSEKKTAKVVAVRMYRAEKSIAESSQSKNNYCRRPSILTSSLNIKAHRKINGCKKKCGH